MVFNVLKMRNNLKFKNRKLVTLVYKHIMEYFSFTKNLGEVIITLKY